MESSKLSDLFFDPYRKKWVKNRPEELIRVALLDKMINELAYPFSLIAIEKELSALPHLTSQEKRQVPKRRIDIVVFSKDIHPNFPLFPLMLIECKAVPLDPASAAQLIGYNDVVKAPLIVLVNETTVLTGVYDNENKKFDFLEGMPDYHMSKKRCSASI